MPTASLSPADTMLRHLRATDAMKNFSEFRQEASMLHALQHPCIVSLMGISIHPLCFALELAPLGSLNTVLSENAKGTCPRRVENIPQGFPGAWPGQIQPLGGWRAPGWQHRPQGSWIPGGSLLLPGLAVWGGAHLPHGSWGQLSGGEERHVTRSTPGMVVLARLEKRMV